jgi:hypothetical protein
MIALSVKISSILGEGILCKIPKLRAVNVLAAKGMLGTCVAVSYGLHGREAIMFWEVGRAVRAARRP